jgi:MoaA/NifB/PqqE/SkfB family radical SAM enzyme
MTTENKTFKTRLKNMPDFSNKKPTSFEYKGVRQLHVELTNRCNAACPLCPRFHANSALIRPDLKLNDISLEEFKTWFPPALLKQLKLILFCGVHGDPCIAQDTLEIVKYITDANPNLPLQFNTNGGMRNPEWWAELGAVLATNKHSRLIFSVDGLEDTNHLYRRNVQWHKLMNNVKAFIGAGGRAYWDYLIFQHNEHQLDEAKQLAIDLGFIEFNPKKSLGFIAGDDLVPVPVLTKTGSFDYWIYPPTDPKNRNLENPKNIHTEIPIYTFTPDQYKNIKQGDPIARYKESYKNIYSDEILEGSFPVEDNYSIDCKYLRLNGYDNEPETELFIDNFGNVMPCCYVGTHYNSTFPATETKQIHYEFDKYGRDNFNLNLKTLKEILDEGHLNKLFVDSWKKKSFHHGKMLFCAKTCGQNSQVDRINQHEGRTILKDEDVK